MDLFNGGGGYSLASSAIGGKSSTGGQSFGAVTFGSMSQGLDARWLVGAAVLISLMFFAYLVWG